MTVSNTETTETPVEQQPQSDCSPVKEHASTGTTEDELAGQLNHMSLGSIHTSKRVMVDVDHSKVALIFWEATVTGRRLIDEMINLGAYYHGPDGQDLEFNEYVMPYGKLPVNVTRNYNLRIVDTGRYRMLKEVRSNRMLKSKSEVAACNDFAAWLALIQRDHFPDKKIVLVYFEPRHSKILQLFQNLERFRLLDDVKKILLGCVNGWDLLRPQIGELKDEQRQVLKALVEAHLSLDSNSASPSTPLEHAAQRAKAVHRVLTKVQGHLQLDLAQLKLEEHVQDSSYLLDQVKKIKDELLKEAQWRPVFADMFRQGLKPRRRAGFLRHLLVESGLAYSDVADAFKEKQDGVVELVKDKMTKLAKMGSTNDADVEELIKLLTAHLSQPERPMRRGSGRRGPRTRSLCVTETDKMENKKSGDHKNHKEENNNVNETGKHSEVKMEAATVEA